MTRAALVVASLLFGVTACAQNYQTADHEQCTKQGLEQGSKSYDDCRAQLETARKAQRRSTGSYGGAASGLSY